MHGCSSTAERAVKNELPVVNLERHYSSKVNAVEDFRWDDRRRATKFRMRSRLLASDLSSFTTGAVLPVDCGCSQI
jgi:hypothetical protein